MFESPSTLKRIGVNAFRETSLGDYTPSTDNVEIPKSVETIGDSAFRQCAKLTHVRFGFEEGIFSGSSLTHIAPSVFAFTNLYHFIVPPSVQNISDSVGVGVSHVICIDHPVSTIRAAAHDILCPFMFFT